MARHFNASWTSNNAQPCLLLECVVGDLMQRQQHTAQALVSYAKQHGYALVLAHHILCLLHRAVHMQRCSSSITALPGPEQTQ